MTIDWSKAPEGATHYIPEGGVLCSFIRKEGDQWYWYDGGVWVAYVGQSWVTQLQGLIERPAAYSGEGLPPVGTVCEYQWAGVCRQVEIIAHWMAPGNLVAIYVPLEGGVHSTECGRAIANAFRPLRTPEQIAADERENTAKQICLDAGSPDLTQGQMAVAYRLYDAGYRKVEGGAV